MISYSSGEPQETLEAIVSDKPEVTTEVLNEVWSTMAYTYGSPPLIANQLLDQIYAFPYVTNTNAKVQLRKLVQLFFILVLTCNSWIKTVDREVFARNCLMDGKKLSNVVQRGWQKIGQHYVTTHGGFHPRFKVLMNFLSRKAIENTIYTFVPIKRDDQKDQKKVTVLSLHTSAAAPKSPIKQTDRVTNTMKKSEWLSSLRICHTIRCSLYHITEWRGITCLIPNGIILRTWSSVHTSLAAGITGLIVMYS